MNRKENNLSLRTLLMLLVGLLVLVALSFAVRDLQQSLSVYRKALVLAERNAVADNCLQAVKNFAFERGRSNVVLLGHYPISELNRRFIDERRALADTHLGQVLGGLPDTLGAEGLALRQAWDKVRILRQVLDTHFPLQRNERDATLADQWLLAANELMTSLDQVLTGVSMASGDIDARFERMSHLRVLALQFRDLVGRESTALGTELSSGRVPSLERVISVKELRGRSLQLWSQIEPGVSGLADRGSSEAIEVVRSELFAGLRPLQDQMIAEASRNNRAPITLNSYLSASVSALDSTIELADSINRAAANYTQQRLDAARWQMSVSLASIAAILTLAGLVIMLLMRRFTQPLNDILQRIDKLIGRQATSSQGAPSPLVGDDFAKVGQALTLLDQTMEARLRSEAALHESERINSSILACTPQSVIVTDAHGFISVFSPGAERMLGYSAEEVIGKCTPLLFHDHGEIVARASELSHELDSTVEPDFNALIAMTKVTSLPDEREWTYVRKDGHRIRVLLAITYLRNAQGEMIGYLGVASDVTERSRVAHEMSRLAYYDHLTRLPNRRLLHDRMQMALNQARREQTRLALLLIDLDKFKPINDEYGHAVGDLLLKAVAERMQQCVRDSDTLARIGGDEFVVVLSGIGEGLDALGVAEKIRLALNTPFELVEGIVADIACSIGVALYPEHGLTEKSLFKKADDAMYQAKDLGRNRVHLCNEPAGPGKVEGGDLPIMRLVWHSAYRCGEASIDQEHEALFRCANTLLNASLSVDVNPAKVLVALDELIEAIKMHFSHEEVILAHHHFEGLDDHAMKHRKLVERALELRRMAMDGELSLGELVTFLTRDVVSLHMLREDQKFFPLLRQALGYHARDPAVTTQEHSSHDK
ncbi:MAG: diguanylate cyclase [Betaproteobacteria bacterium]